MNEKMELVLDGLIKDNAAVNATYYSLKKDRGLSVREAREEIARAFLGCLWEAQRGMPDRFADVLQALRDGRSSSELFPDGFYEEPGSEPH